MSIYAFNEYKEKVPFLVAEGVIRLIDPMTAESSTTIYTNIDLRNYAIVGVMCGYGASVGETNYKGNPASASVVVNGTVYPNAEIDLTSNYRSLKVNLYNANDTSESMWYRIVLLKVSDEY